MQVIMNRKKKKKRTDYKIQKQTQACIKSDSVEKVEV